MIQFLYNGKIYDTSDLNKKLKKMGITESDVEIINKTEIKDEPGDAQVYRFINHITGETIISIYPDLLHLKEFMDITNFELE